MSGPSAAVPPRVVPTLTEVVQVTAPRPFGATSSAPPAAPLAPEQALAQRLLLDVQRQVDLLLEQRLRETMAPLVARLADELVSQARDQLAATLRELITQAVAREMARRREP